MFIVPRPLFQTQLMESGLLYIEHCARVLVFSVLSETAQLATQSIRHDKGNLPC